LGSANPQFQGGGPQHNKIFGTPTYAQTVWSQATKFDITHMVEERVSWAGWGQPSDVNKDWTCKDKDKDQAYKDQDKDKDKD